MSRVGLYWRTLRYLTTRQILYQILNRLRSRPRFRLQKNTPEIHFLTVPEADKPISWQSGTFTFLNQRVSFPQRIDWNYAANGKLWTYNLNYFDFLNQPNATAAAGLNLIYDFIELTGKLRDGLEPYPTSLRLINWIQFLSRHQIRNNQINTHLFAQTHLLSRRLEHHLGGNHLLENGFSLLIGALYFRHDRLLKASARLIRTELTRQILCDGAHYERSPMYHQILLNQLLTVLVALQPNTWYNDSSFLSFLTQKAAQMLNWLNTITFRNGDVPMVNDAAFGVAPTTLQLQQKAVKILPASCSEKAIMDFVARYEKPLCKMSGYRMFRQNRYELFVDVGLVGPHYQPGHAHADTFSFVLYVDNQPVIVDSGTSTYQIGKRRSWERSTAAHNTVEVAGTNSSEVWAGFRVGRRAQVMVMRDTETILTARHSGYQHLGIIHQRSWSVEPGKVTIVDRLLKVTNEFPSEQIGIARFHFHPNIDIQINSGVVTAGPTELSFNSVTKLNFLVTRYDMAAGFNTLHPAQCVTIAFTNSLETTLTVLNEHTLPDLLFRT